MESKNKLKLFVTKKNAFGKGKMYISIVAIFVKKIFAVYLHTVLAPLLTTLE